jgi:hypothetical protein
MKLYGTDKRELMTVSRIEREGNQLLIRAKVFGTMPMTAALTPADARAALRLLGWRGILFLLTLPFRRSPSTHKEKP